MIRSRKHFMIPVALKEALTVTLLLIGFGLSVLRFGALSQVYPISSNVVSIVIAGDRSNTSGGVMASISRSPSVNNDGLHDRHEHDNGHSHNSEENPMPAAPGAVPVTV